MLKSSRILKEFGPEGFKVRETVARIPSLDRHGLSYGWKPDIFCLRIDADEYTPDSFNPYYSVFERYRGAITIFFNINSFKDAKDHILRCRDIGISVGEKSSPVISNSEFIDCKIAIESKDASKPIIYGCNFKGNDTAYHAYLKKWEYGSAGYGYLIASKITVDNKKGIILEDDALLNVFKTDCRADILGEERLIHMDRLNVEIAKTVERLGKFKEDEVGTQKPF